MTRRIDQGIVKVGEKWRSWACATQKTVCTGVEMFRKLLDQGQAGDNVGVLLRGASVRTWSAARCCASRARSPHTRLQAGLYLTKEEGGRHAPFFTNYRPQFYFRTTDVTGIVQLKEGVEMVMPGDSVGSTSNCHPDRHGTGPALHHPRRRPHGRKRRGLKIVK